MEIARTALEFGIYRDGDNNLDDQQSFAIAQAFDVSSHDRSIEFNIEDTTSRRGLEPRDVLRTERYVIRSDEADSIRVEEPHDMSRRANLSEFVAQTLDRAQRNGAAQTWIELVDHGGGDGGGLESDSFADLMSERDIAGAISDGVAHHASAHPEDAHRSVDGVIANQCLMATLGFADALSQAGVRYLGASPETMLAPGVPTTVAREIARNEADPAAMAAGVVKATMSARYVDQNGGYAPAAAFSVLDLDPQKIATIRERVKTLDDAVTRAVAHDDVKAHVRGDIRATHGVARFGGPVVPWRADRPAIALYDRLAADARLPQAVRSAAEAASTAVKAIVIAHDESPSYAPFGGKSYTDAVGPTVHAPLSEKQLDPWAPQISETDNAFWKAVHGEKSARALA